MNRRSFFKAVTGFVAGLVTVFVPKTKAKEEWIDVKNFGANTPGMSVKEWVDAQFNPVKELQFGEHFEGRIVSMCNFEGNLWIATEKGVYRIKKLV